MRPDLLLRRALLTLVGSLFCIGSALAAPEWKNLSPQQQALITPALKSQGGDFDKLPEPRRSALVKGAERWLAMSAAQRVKATQQFSQWQRLDTAEKIRVLEQREQFRRLSPDQRRALLDTQQQFLDLTADRQAELRNEFTELQAALSNLPSQAFSPPSSPSPGTPPPLGLPMTVLPLAGEAVPPLLLPLP